MASTIAATCYPRGHCSFYALVSENKLKDHVIKQIAQSVDEAVIVQEAMAEPAEPGLELICRGIRRGSQNDLEAFETVALVYEALYADLLAGLAQT